MTEEFLVMRVSCLFSYFEQTLLFEGANSLGANLHCDFFAVNDKSLLLKVWLPDFLGVALRKADIAAVLLTFAC